MENQNITGATTPHYVGAPRATQFIMTYTDTYIFYCDRQVCLRTVSPFDIAHTFCASRVWHAFLETLEDFPGPKAIFEIQSLSISDEVFSPKISANFLVD